jgi:YVTN family beta-propeller protein
MQYRLLGPVEVVGDAGQPVALSGDRERVLVAVLVLGANQVVSSARLVDALWGDRPPMTAVNALQVHVSRLRKKLAAASAGRDLLHTESSGYRLTVAAGESDVKSFEDLVGVGGDDPEEVSSRLGEALGLCRGAALVDVASDLLAGEAARLEELRLAALEQRIEADLARGGQAQLVPELEGLVHDHPLRETLRGQLMRALYRCGRQADALAVYRQGRAVLADQLGIDPSPALQALELAILQQSPELASPEREIQPSEHPTPSWPPPTPAHLPRTKVKGLRRRASLLASAAALVAATVAVTSIGLSAHGRTVRAKPNSLAAIDTRSNRLSGLVPVGARPGAIAFGAGSLWVANRDDQTVSRVDPAGLQVLRTLPVGGSPTGVAASADAIWVAESSSGSAGSMSVIRIAPDFNTIGPPSLIDEVVPGSLGEVAANGDAVWVAPSSGLLTRLDAVTGRVTQQVDPNAGPTAIDVGDGGVWVTDSEANNATRLDPTGLLTSIPVGNGPSGIAIGAGAVWVADSLDGAVVRIDPATRSVTTTIPVGQSPTGVAVGAGSVWVANSGDGTVDRIDPRTDRVVARIAAGGSPQAVTVANGRAWVTIDAQTIRPATTPKVGSTLRMDSQSDVDFMDPALAYAPLSWQLLYATCAKLLNYPDRAGAAGSRLIPEVAQSLPAVSADGRSYTFTVRGGFRFSPPSDEPVTAQTFKDTIERTLNPRMHSPVAGQYADIVGADMYMAGKTPHIAGVIAQGDTLVIQLRAPAPDFLARIAEPAMCAVPADTPIDPTGLRTIPSAGPYYVASYTPGQGIVLDRNPNYHGSRPQSLAQIEFSAGISTRQSVSAVESGHADYTTLTGSSASSAADSGGLTALATQLATRYGHASSTGSERTQRYFANPEVQLDYLILNTHRPLFSDTGMRQAVNYAIDRTALAQLGNPSQPVPEHPTDHYLPPGIAGYRDVHIYSLTADPAKARQVEQGNGRSAVLYTCEETTCVAQAQIVKTDLAAIDLQVKVKTFPLSTLVSLIARPGEPFDLAFGGGWIPDYPDPAAMLTELTEDKSVGPTYDDLSYRHQLAAAGQLEGPQRYLAFGQLDLELARDAAPLVAYGNLNSGDLFSPRVGCQTFGPYGIDLAALCIRNRPR